jgi:hypothetical protein
MKVRHLTIVAWLSAVPAFAQTIDLFGGYNVVHNTFTQYCGVSTCTHSTLPIGWAIDVAARRHHIAWAGQVSGNYGSVGLGTIGYSGFDAKDHIHMFLTGLRIMPTAGRVAPFAEALAGLVRRHSDSELFTARAGHPPTEVGMQFALVNGGRRGREGYPTTGRAAWRRLAAWV